MKIEITNLTKPQELAIEDMLNMWMVLSGLGGSRWVAFYADGDGDFHPKIKVNGKKPESCSLGNPKGRWRSFCCEEGCSGEGYFMDFDEISWQLPESVKRHVDVPFFERMRGKWRSKWWSIKRKIIRSKVSINECECGDCSCDKAKQ